MNQSAIIGHRSLGINCIGLGCLGMSAFYGSFNEAGSICTLHRAIDLGLNFFGTADMYGRGANKVLLDKAFKGHWEEVVLATKFAIMRGAKGEFLGLSRKPLN